MASSKASLHQMRTYLLQHHQTLVTMTPEQASAYQTEMHRLDQAGRIVADTFITLEKFCRSMPLDWIIPSSESSSSSLSSSSTAALSLSQSDSFSDAPSTFDLQQQQQLLQPPKPQLDFSAAFLHLLREPRAGIQIVAVDCIEQLVLRGKLTFSQWMRLVQELPTAIAQTNQQFVVEQEHAAAEVAVVSSLSSMSYTTPPPAVLPNVDPLTAQIDFHRPLSRMLANVISSHLSHVSYDKKLLSKAGPEWTNFSNFLRLLVDMLHHPSGRLCGEQINMWTSVLRDPQILKARLLQPFVQEILSCYMDHMVRIRWVDVEEGTHPLASLMEASWEDEVRRVVS
jgi:hypothetical protein